MADLGFFAEERVELIGGEIQTVSPQSNFHSSGIKRTERLLELAFGNGYWVRAQMTLDLSPLSQPDPDIAVIVGDYLNPTPAVPRGALLIVEVSDTTLRLDRTRKASLYAAAGIEDYWILNLVDRQLEIRRDPRPDATQDFGHGYASLATLLPGDFASPLALPGAKVAVADLLPI